MNQNSDGAGLAGADVQVAFRMSPASHTPPDLGEESMRISGGFLGNSTIKTLN